MTGVSGRPAVGGDRSADRARLEPAAVARTFGLGAVRRWEVVGGDANLLARLETERGAWAVKVLSPVGVLADRGFLERAVAVERAAIDTGVSAPEPVRPVEGDGWVAELPAGRALPQMGGGWFMPPHHPTVRVRVHRWVEGIPVGTHRPPAWFCRLIGAALGRIHRALPGGPGGDAAVTPRPEDLSRLEAVAPGRAAEVSDLAAALRGALARRPGWTPVRTHRDLVPGNVIVVDGEPWICDWDAAGPWTAEEDLATAVAAWGAADGGDLDVEAGAALVAGYREEGGPATLVPEAAWGGVAGAVTWAAARIAAGAPGGEVVDELLAGVAVHRRRIRALADIA